MFVLKSDISFSSLNCRGLKDSVKRKAIFLFCKSQKSHCFFLQETHSELADVTFWKKQWGDVMLFSHGSNRSAGVAICMNKCPGKIITHRADVNGHWLAVVLYLDEIFFILVNVYGYNVQTQNKGLLETITNVISDLKTSYPTDYILIGGDFNMSPDEYMDRQPSKFDISHANSIIQHFCLSIGLIDIWRNLNPTARHFSWFKPNATSKSRIDYWLGSESLSSNATKCNISGAPLTDHCVINLILEQRNKPCNTRGYWKFNADLLNHTDFCTYIKKIIAEFKVKKMPSGIKWEYLKHKLREYSMTFSKNLMKKKRKKEFQLIQDINKCCCQPNMSDEDKEKLIKLHSILDEFYIKKAKGAYVRSRAKWLEEGEKNSSYFINLEKRRQEKNSINSLIVNQVEQLNHNLIVKEVFKFYSNLYSSSFSSVNSNSFFQMLKNNIPSIDSVFKELCDSDLTLQELDAAIKQSRPGKSPGPDGLTTDFYNFFWDDLKYLLFEALQECINNIELLPTMKQGLIILIPKPGKDKRILDNLRPITLLNTDYKLFTKALASRLKTGISQIISVTQSGFLKDRSIHNNIRLVFDLVEYGHLIEEDGLILFLDFYKAFDMVEHSFIFQTLKHFGFGSKFISIVGMLYKDINSSVALTQGTCPRFEVRRGIRQGCGCSPLLFIMVAEMLSILLKMGTILGIDFEGNNFIVSQFADDTTLFLRNEQQIPLALQLIKFFSEASGLKLNMSKCELLAIHDHPNVTLYNIPVKNEVKYLGIWLSKRMDNLEHLNFDKTLDNCKLIMNTWLQRDITIFGRILLTKVENLSRFIYPCFSLSVSAKRIKAVNKLNFDFIWKMKSHYIRKSDMIKDYEEGGLKTIDFDIMNGVIKLRWLQAFINDKSSFWFEIPTIVFNKCGGISFLLQCDFELSKLPVKLSAFHQQVLLYWKLIFKHNFSPHNMSIWNNRCITVNRKSLFIDEWWQKGIWSLTHLVDNVGNILSHVAFCGKYNISCSSKMYEKIIKNIPLQMLKLVSEHLKHSRIIPKVQELIIENVSFVDRKCSNKFLRDCLIHQCFPGPVLRNYIFRHYEKKEVCKIRTNFLSFPVNPKCKEVHFKILNHIYPTKEFLRTRFNVGDSNLCQICKVEIETVEHLFFQCSLVNKFWNDALRWMQQRIPVRLILSWEFIKFGLLIKDKKVSYVINNVLLLLKFYIHKCKFFKIPPKLVVFKEEFKVYLETVRRMKSPKAVYLYSLLEDFDFIN